MNGCDIEVPSNSFIIYQEGTRQYYAANGTSYSNDWLHFSPEKEDLDYLRKLNIPFDCVKHVKDISLLSNLMKTISTEFFSDGLLSNETALLYLNILFLKLSELLNSDNRKVSCYCSKMDVVRSNIYSTPQNSWNVDIIAKELSLSRSRFQHLYKEIYGISIINEIINSRIEHAKHLLHSTDMTVKQVALLSGYSNDVHFIRQFKSRMSCTPIEYRNKSS
jgi:AraC family transcriptional regulator of arabinose operon